MSLRRSTSGGDLLLSRNAERTPLRSLHNENLDDSTESFGVKSKSEPLKQTKENLLVCSQKSVPESTDRMISQKSDESTEHYVCKLDNTPVPDGLVSPRHFHSKFEELDTEHATSYCADMTLKSYQCDGGEVEISDEAVGKADDTILLSQTGIGEYPLHVHTLDSSNILDSTDYCNTEEEKTDHAYCRRESGTASDISMTEVQQDNPCDALADITLKFLNCTGGEIEIRDSIQSVNATIPLTAADQNGDSESHTDSVDSHFFTEDCNVDHFDHPYCNTVRVDSAHAANQPSIHEVLNEKEQSYPKLECREAVLPPTPDPQEQYSPIALITNIVLKKTNDYNEEDTSIESKDCVVENALPPVNVSPSSSNNKSDIGQEHDTKESLDFDVGALALPQHSSNESYHKTVSTPHTDAKEKDVTHSDSHLHSSTRPHEGSDTADSALGLSPKAPVSAEPPQAETLPDVFKAITECTPLHLRFLTPIIRRASLACLQAQKELVANQCVGDDCGVVADLDHAESWREHLDSPMARPLFNSTELVHRSQACTITELPKDVTLTPPAVQDCPVTNLPVISEGPLQQQLRQMAEFLLLASGKLGPPPASAPAAPPAKTEYHNACVGTSPMRMVNHSINTSVQHERKMSLSVEDQCTLTDPLLWNVPVDSLESVPKPELEQRVLSSMIIVEALVQQLAAARAHTLPPAGAAPSELREKTVQTEHTELSQTSLHRDLYLEAVSRIKDLEMDNVSLQKLSQYMQNVKITMAALTSDTDAALCQMKQMEEVVQEDHNSLVSNYGQMKSLLEKSRESQMRMVQKVKDVLQQKEDMHTKMEEAFSAKEAAYSVMEQLRRHCSVEVSELEKCVGSQQELLTALKKANPEKVTLNKAYSETLNFASDLLSKTTEEQSSLEKELCRVRGLLQKCTPILQKLNERADVALRDRDKHIAERDQALQDKEQCEEELNQALQNLQAAKGQISDLNLQVTILASEMGVLRQKLSESDDERAQLDRKATELSATVASTLASYAFLEQALASETTKLQQSWADIKQAKERAQELETSLGQSEQHVAELREALTHSEDQVSQLQSVSEAQTLRLQQLQDLCTQLSGVRDMNEFLQMENELSREQIAESERMLTANLQSLRERNIQCEDLNGELHQLQHANKNLQEELDCVRSKFIAGQSQHKEKLEQIVTEIAILHHTVRSVTNELHASLTEENSKELALSISDPLVESDMAQSTEEEEENPNKAPSNAAAQSELVFSETSAFTRITAVTQKKRLSTEREAEELQSNVLELLVGLDSTITELRNTLASVQQQKDALLKDRHHTICGLQRELEAAQSSHQTEVSELQFQLSRLNARMEKVNVSLQQKTQDERTVSKLVGEMSEIQETLNKHKAESNEMRKETVELRRSLQKSRSEAQFLRDELSKNGGLSASSADFMEEKIALLKEMERLKMNLQDKEEARKKLLDRAKRHQAIYETNQQKSEKELQLLNNMLNKVRETLLSLPGTMKNCEQLQQLMEYIG